MKTPRRLPAVAALLLGVLLAACAGPTPEIRQVARIIDGDTIVLDDGERVRLIGVDTPETVHPTKPVEHFGTEASAFTRSLLAGATVRLTFDREQRDRFDRLLAYVWVGDLFVNAELIRRGYARAYTKYPFRQDYMDLFRALEQEARGAGRGLWATTD